MSSVRQHATRDPVPGNTFLGASANREYISFRLDTLPGSGIVIMGTCANDAGNQHLTTASDSAGNTVGAFLEHHTNSGNTDNALYAYIATSPIARGLVSIATSGSDATHVNDTSQNWLVNEWAGTQVLDYLGNTRTVSSNTATQLVVSSGTSIASGAQYVLGGYIRVNYTPLADFAGFAASEIYGVSSVIATSYAYPTVGSGTDNISSGTKALGSSPIGLWSGCYCDTAATAPGASSRSNTVDLGTSWIWTQGTPSTRFQYRTVANPGTLDATFSSTGSANYNTFDVAFLDAATAAYAPPLAGPYTSALTGGSMSPVMPAFIPGQLLLLETGVNSITLGAPTVTGWTKLSPNSNGPCAALYARIAVFGDTSPSVQWDASHQAYSRITAVGGDVYTDLSTIVSVSGDRGTNAQGKIAVGSTSAPAQNNCLVIRGGFCLKTATNNGASFADWLTDSGLYTKIGSTQLVQTGSALAAGLWYWQQTTATATSQDTAALTNADTSANTQGFTVILKSSGTLAAPIRTRSLLGVGT
jgi:hypothetical protein